MSSNVAVIPSMSGCPCSGFAYSILAECFCFKKHFLYVRILFDRGLIKESSWFKYPTALFSSMSQFNELVV